MTWQPIESALKDRTSLLLIVPREYDFEGDVRVVGSWQELERPQWRSPYVPSRLVRLGTTRPVLGESRRDIPHPLDAAAGTAAGGATQQADRG